MSEQDPRLDALGARGRKAQRQAMNLLVALRETTVYERPEVLTDFTVPFTNNLRTTCRMILKLRMKISELSAPFEARRSSLIYRSVISTCQKNHGGEYHRNQTSPYHHNKSRSALTFESATQNPISVGCLSYKILPMAWRPVPKNAGHQSPRKATKRLPQSNSLVAERSSYGTSKKKSEQCPNGRVYAALNDPEFCGNAFRVRRNWSPTIPTQS